MKFSIASSLIGLYQCPPTLKCDPTITPEEVTLSSFIFFRVTPDPTMIGKSLIASRTSCTEIGEGG